MDDVDDVEDEPEDEDDPDCELEYEDELPLVELLLMLLLLRRLVLRALLLCRVALPGLGDLRGTSATCPATAIPESNSRVHTARLVTQTPLYSSGMLICLSPSLPSGDLLSKEL